MTIERRPAPPLLVELTADDWALAKVDGKLVTRGDGGMLGKVLTTDGRYTAATAQRIVAAYALRLGNMRELQDWYGYGDRMVKAIVNGESLVAMTAPVRAWLVAHAICDGRVHRGVDSLRALAIREAQENVARRAWRMLSNPAAYTDDDLATVARDLWILSGEWLNDDDSGPILARRDGTE